MVILMEVQSKAKMREKNKWASILVSSTVVACTALVLFARANCGSGPMTEGPAGPVCGDGVCEQSEAYPCEMGKDRLFKKGPDGKCVVNKSFCPEDCHVGDGVLQSKTDDMKDMNGSKMTLMPKSAGKESLYGLPESNDSIDYRLQLVRSQPCVPGTPTKDTKMIDRPLVKANPGEEIIRPMDEWEQMVRDPKSLPPSIYNPAIGMNSFKRPWLLEEVCDNDPKVPDCAPNVNERCFPANHVKCPPRAPPKVAVCKNKKWEKELGEQCDPTDKKAVRGGCESGYHCTGSCTCKKDDTEVRCGNKIVEGDEECDPPGSACKTSDDSAGKCNSVCVCEKKEEPVPESYGKCDPNTIGGTFASRIIGAVTGKKGEIRARLGKQPDEQVEVSVGVQIDIDTSNRAIPSIMSITSNGQSVQDLVSINLANAGVPVPDKPCRGTVKVTLPP